MPYTAPLAEILFTLHHVAAPPRLWQDGLFPALDEPRAAALLAEAGSLAESLLMPLDKVGGRALPRARNSAILEMRTSACVAPVLTQGAINTDTHDTAPIEGRRRWPQV
jgi:hypothetical protein